jgi:hypothetical protein
MTALLYSSFMVLSLAFTMGASLALDIGQLQGATANDDDTGTKVPPLRPKVS